MILLDTNVCIGFLHGDSDIVQRLGTVLEHEEIGIPGMVEGELHYGVEKSTHREENREKTALLLSLLPVYHTTDAIMAKFGELKAELEAAGNRVDDADLIIAATALCHDAVLATGNTRHFERFQNLKLENWFRETKH